MAFLERGRIREFATSMTGELFDLLRTHSILADQLHGTVTDGRFFREGVRRGAERGLQTELFRIRARGILEGDRDAAAFASGLVSLPGIFTATEAFAALQAGATALKLFPAEASSPAMVKALKAVLPKTTRLLPVGGITPDTLPKWYAADVAGFGLGSALFRPNYEVDQVRARAEEFVTCWRSLIGD